MATFPTDICKKNLVTADIDWANDDIRLILLMTSTTADTETDKLTVGGYTTLDEFDGTGYTSGAGGEAASGEAVIDVGDDAAGDLSDHTFTNLDGGSRDIQAVLVIRFDTNQANSIPLLYIDDFTTFSPNGGDFTVTWSANGVLRVTS